uniref:Venom peptide SjAPI-like n=1 Tax=Diabrotica virgifera virgifera TaxID=50390 RepID=A0A6P7F723_DIAVI
MKFLLTFLVGALLILNIEAEWKNPSNNPFFKCGKFEYTDYCASCEATPTCTNRNPKPIIYQCQCFPACLCEKGYVREEISKDCILPEKCPKL